MRRKSVLNSHLKIHQKTVSAEPKLMEDLGYFDYITYSFDSPKKPTSSSPKNYRRMQTPSVHSACYHATPRRKSLGLQASDFLH